MSSSRKEKIFVWQWGRFGAGPRYAYELSHGLRSQGLDVLLSLSGNAEIMRTIPAREVDLLFPTYANLPDFAIKSLLLGRLLRRLDRFIDTNRPDVAICAMPGIWSVFVAWRFREFGIPVVTIVHDAQGHPGDHFGPLHRLQQRLVRMSAGIITLSDFVARQLSGRGLLHDKPHEVISHIPFLFPDFDLPPPLPPGYPERAVLRVLLAGRLRAYKGVGPFLEALRQLPASAVEVRVAGRGAGKWPGNSTAGMNVDLRPGWCSERELIAHIDWADLIVAPYIEASQSGIVTLALDRCRPVVATPVGGLPEQVKHEETGLVAEAAAAEAAVAAIRRFLDRPRLFIHCRENACRQARTENDWRHIAPRFRNIIRRVIAHSSRVDGERNRTPHGTS